MSDRELPTELGEGSGRGGRQALVNPALALRCGGARVLLPLHEIREVAQEPEPISQIPRATPPILGAINLRGRAIGLIELAGLLGRSPQRGDPALRRVVLLEGSALALRVEEVLGIAELEEASEGEPLSAAWIRERVEGLLSPARQAMDYVEAGKDGG